MSIDFWVDMENDPDAQARIKKSVELLDLKDNLKVLDLGCHKQEVLKYIKHRVFYVGVDYEMLVPDTLKLDIDGVFSFPEKVDRIICLETLEHLLMPKGTLQSIHTLLKDDGIAVISLPNEATLFHRLRCLFGIVDQECFNYGGKHLHLPSLNQCRKLLSEFFKIDREVFYITKQARGTKQPIMKIVLACVPSSILQFLANMIPSFFARGFIFKLTKK